MKIPALTTLSFLQPKFNFKKPDNKTENSAAAPSIYPKNWYISFEARVDKGLNSFYQRNSTTMPKTMKEFVQTLDFHKRTKMSPAEAQYRAFERLEDCKTVEEIKAAFPDEPLFSNLKSEEDLKSKRGLLGKIRLQKDEGTALKSGEDLTVYLVKKVYLEGKTIAEINADLDNDINSAFQGEKDYILPSTLKALGLELPRIEYLNSLRYTREGYSDRIGEKLHLRYLALSEEEKEKRRYEFLQRTGDLTPEKQEELRRIRSERAADFWANLSEERRFEISQKQSEAQKARYSSMTDEERELLSENAKNSWRKMSPEQKTAQINALQTGNARQRISMIYAWNNCPEIRSALSIHLINSGFEAQNVIYSKESFSSQMSKIMTEFWSLNPEFAAIFGASIIEGYLMYDKHQALGDVEEFSKNMIQKSEEIRRKIRENSAGIKTLNPIKKSSEPIKTQLNKQKTKTNFLQAEFFPSKKFLPQQFLRDLGGSSNKLIIEEDTYKSAKRMLQRQDLTEEEKSLFETQVSYFETLNANYRRILNAFAIAGSMELLQSVIPREITLENIRDKASFTHLFDLGPVQIARLIGDAQRNARISIPGAQNANYQVFYKPNSARFEKNYLQYHKGLSEKEKKMVFERLTSGMRPTKARQKELEELKKQISQSGRYILLIFDESVPPPVRMKITQRSLKLQNAEWPKDSTYFRTLKRKVEQY